MDQTAPGGEAPNPKIVATPPTRDSKPAALRPFAPRDKEIGGPSGPEPTRYGDWEHKGRCSDF